MVPLPGGERQAGHAACTHPEDAQVQSGYSTRRGIDMFDAHMESDIHYFRSYRPFGIVATFLPAPRAKETSA